MAVIPKFVRGVMVPSVMSKANVLRYSYGLSDVSVRFQSDCCPDSGGDKNQGGPTLYDCRKLGHNLSTNNVCPGFETLRNIPTGVFRNTTGEMLGRNASKCQCYQNPEYFSFHHMSFYDLNLGLRQYRKAIPKTRRKPIVYRPPC
ncbi:uncharacterized protein LOC118274143 [Spodoptera frugiperda]|uniref:Uncharacterized protein LOC118274143 n=1 Tax=Spodoptera frugiperda TaxID=7108 RepID=A0A9R0EZ68_SPOFR|nr:uncharacterized protein LOC118274143 [Spodoptera frugiperda]